MNPAAYSRPAKVTVYRTRIRKGRVAGLLLAVAAMAALIHQVSASTNSSSPTTTTLDADGNAHRRFGGANGGVLGEADGAVPDGTTVFDDGVPGVANLDPDLLAAVLQASTDSGIRFFVDSGWRSERYQQRLLDEAVAKYGSAEEAARWVATPEKSAHVSGDAVDIGHSDATDWLSAHGAAYGLCRTYDNEPWHFELRPDAAVQGCPPRYPDAAHDPRLQG